MYVCVCMAAMLSVTAGKCLPTRVASLESMRCMCVNIYIYIYIYISVFIQVNASGNTDEA
jgi:hypothetical protein